MDAKKNKAKTSPAKKQTKGGSKKRLPGFFSDYGGSGIVVDSMPNRKKK